ncbi:SDR family oxidoreductase [Pseudofrankia asymbiotica]|uniref:3-oxoacyl-ACP reductase n=1 Tax=Pseudofrankia asymbiotica TaxID=1834516 RepID=A0A1V2I0T2_9ACTN|nr:SDR family oxidoreductase [Pseudofrankia asymbiotica]ONH22525.1 3-oxoacyl-ACP reductase [Pseudofrankia asymbiotica]
MDLKLKGKCAVVTGGSKGVGLATVQALLAEGMRVVSGSRSATPELLATAAVPVLVDLAVPQGPAELVRRAVAELGGIDLLVNNVGIGDPAESVGKATSTLATLPDAAWEDTFNLVFYTALRTTRAALPSLVDRRGTVVNISSAGARLVSAGPFDYNVSKAALNALGKVIAEQYGPQGVRSVTVSPGPISTGVWTSPDGFIARLAQAQGLEHQAFAQQLMDTMGSSTGRITTPAEVARLVTFLASPINITGAEYLIDGGLIKNV